MIRAQLLAALMAVSVAQEPYPVKFDFHRIKSWDGTELNGNSYVPIVEANSTKKFPLVIFINSWGSPSIEYVAPVNRFAKKGYVGLEYAARGFYGSGGEAGVAGPDDIKDVTAIITWALQKWPMADPEQVALGGISYGAGISLEGAGADSRVKAVLALSGWKSLIDALWWQQAPSLVWSDILVILGNSTANLPPQLFQMLNNLMTYQNVNATIEYGHLRSPDRFLTQLNSRKVPILISNNQEDNLFHSNFQLDFWEQLQGPKRLFLNQGTHAEAELKGLIPGEDDTYIWDACDDWLDHFLKGVQNNIEKPPLVRITLGNKEVEMVHETFDTWPPSTGYNVMQYRAGGRGGSKFGTLGASTTAGPDTISFTNNTKMSCGEPVIAPVFKPVVPIRAKLNELDPNHEIAFLTEKFEKDTRVCGNIHLKDLVVSATADRFQVYGYIYSYHNGLLAHSGTLVTHTPTGIWAGYKAGEDYTVPELEFRSACVDIKKGHQLALGLNMKNALYKSANENAGVSMTIKYGPNGGPLLSVPTVQS
eukprot:TRINITY_DN84_c0_g2_i1.p1 TRINITY_DN84_c0_g2~~TRINITY_DN84_c0_g2_i1.p1  ORF type:complete len:535 (+),score=135.70 TRINITY_DN84_c0_g2_i1:67-1671(+)